MAVALAAPTVMVAIGVPPRAETGSTSMVAPWALDVDVRLLATVVSSDVESPSFTASVCWVVRALRRSVTVLRSLFTSTWPPVALFTASITGPRFCWTAGST